MQLFERDWVLMNWALKFHDRDRDILLEPDSVLRALGLTLPVCRVIVNQAHCFATGGSFGAWAEQLIAESTGKEGKGLVPVPGETTSGDDRQEAEVRVSDPYEPPVNPELVLRTEKESPEESAQLVVDKLEQLGLLYGEVRV